MYREQGSAAPILVMASEEYVVGIDRSTGDTVWAVEVSSFPGRQLLELLVTEDRVFAVSNRDDYVYCIRYPDGQLLGHVELGLGTDSRPVMVVDHGQLFISRSARVACLTLDGQLLWRKQILKGERMWDYSTAIGFPGNVRQADDPGSK